MPTVEQLAALTPTDREAIIAPLDTFSRGQGFPWQPVSLALVLREEGAIVGGLIGETQWGWLRISVLSVVENLRGGGWGAAAGRGGRAAGRSGRVPFRVGGHVQFPGAGVLPEARLQRVR